MSSITLESRVSVAWEREDYGQTRHERGARKAARAAGQT